VRYCAADSSRESLEQHAEIRLEGGGGSRKRKDRDTTHKAELSPTKRWIAMGDAHKVRL